MVNNQTNMCTQINQQKLHSIKFTVNWEKVLIISNVAEGMKQLYILFNTSKSVIENNFVNVC